MIKEIIIVEGKDDVAAVKAAVEAEVISTHGYGITGETFEMIVKASKERGIIILTDPDYAGELIRKRINELVPEAKHAYIARQDGEKSGDIGVENAKPEVIRKAIENAHATITVKREVFGTEDMLKYGLLGNPASRKRRAGLGKLLNIGYANGNQLVQRLNNYGIEREEFERAVATLDETDE